MLRNPPRDFEEPEPCVDNSGATYTDADRLIVNRETYQWNHGIGETVTALLRYGLRLEWLVEPDWTAWARSRGSYPMTKDVGPPRPRHHESR